MRFSAEPSTPSPEYGEPVPWASGRIAYEMRHSNRLAELFDAVEAGEQWVSKKGNVS